MGHPISPPIVTGDVNDMVKCPLDSTNVHDRGTTFSLESQLFSPSNGNTMKLWCFCLPLTANEWNEGLPFIVCVVLMTGAFYFSCNNPCDCDPLTPPQINQFFGLCPDTPLSPTAIYTVSEAKSKAGELQIPCSKPQVPSPAK